jgi:hypothetical protein
VSDAQRAELQSLLTRAAVLEAQRQTAQQARDWARAAGLERELAALWQRHNQIETSSRGANQ